MGKFISLIQYLQAVIQKARFVSHINIDNFVEIPYLNPLETLDLLFRMPKTPIQSDN